MQVMKNVTQFIAGMALIFQIACTRVHHAPPEQYVNNFLEVNNRVKEIIRDQVSEFQTDSLWILKTDTLLTATWIAEFFMQNQYTPVWTDKNHLNENADSLISIASSLRFYGLDPEWYRVDSIKAIADQISNTPETNYNITRVYEINILLTDLFFRIASSLQHGVINEKTLSKEWKIDKTDTTMVALIEFASRTNNIRRAFESAEPVSRQYTGLKKFLSRYLQAEPAPRDSENDDIFKDSIRSCIEALMINMERCRWERDSGLDYLVVINIPSNDLEYYSCGDLALKSRVITGKQETPTPFNLNSEIKSFYVYPYWIVPFSIATKEILPKVKKDPAYLLANNMDLFDRNGKLINPDSVNWDKYSINYFPFTIRQRDGDENTLGVLKFIFANNYGIYLHDTNSKQLFNKEDRNLSHGCIRLERAMELSNEISKCCSFNFNSDSISKYIRSKTRKLFSFYKPLPIHIRYNTVKTDGDLIYFYKDVYGLDEKIMQLFKTRYSATASR